MANDKLQVGLRLDPVTLGKITVIAKENKRSFNGQAEYLINECIRQYEKDHGVIVLNPEE